MPITILIKIIDKKVIFLKLPTDINHSAIAKLIALKTVKRLVVIISLIDFDDLESALLVNPFSLRVFTSTDDNPVSIDVSLALSTVGTASIRSLVSRLTLFSALFFFILNPSLFIITLFFYYDIVG